MNGTALQTVRTPETIAAEIRMYSGAMLMNAIEIGRRFSEAKSLMEHGDFGTWIKEQCGYSKSTANNFMRLFEAYGSDQGSLFGTDLKSQTFGNLGYSQALELLALPPAEREEFVETHDVKNTSVRALKEQIAEWKQKADDAQLEKNCAVAERDAANVRAEEAERAVEELRNRPVEVAVAEPDPAMIEDAVNKALAEAQATHDKELQLVKNQFAQKQRELDAALTAKSDAEKAAKIAESQRDAETARAEEADRRAAEAEKNAGGEAEKLKAELERVEAEKQRLEKQIAMSGEAIVSFKERFTQWQQYFTTTSDALKAMDEKTADKCRAAMKAQAEAWLKKLE